MNSPTTTPIIDIVTALNVRPLVKKDKDKAA